MKAEELVLPDLPAGWSWGRLEDLAAPEPNAMTDGPFGSKLKSAHYTDDGVRVIRLGNLGVGHFKNDDQSFIAEEHFETLRKHEVFAGDLLIAALAEPVGRCCRVPEDILPAIVKADCIRFKPHDAFDSNLLMQWLNSPPGHKLAERLSHGIGRLRINMGNMRSLPVAVPPANEQRRIVAKIDALQARSRRAREALDAIPALLDRFRQSVLAAAFRGDLTADWRAAHPDVEPASVLLERIRAERKVRWVEAEAEKARARAQASAEKKGKPWGPEDDAKALASGKAKAAETYEEPEVHSEPDAPTADVYGDLAAVGWESAALEALCDPERGIPYGIVKTGDPTRRGVPTVRCGDVKDFSVDVSQLKLVHPDIHTAYSRTELQGGEVLLAIRGTVGNTAVATAEMAGMNISREVAMIPPLPGLRPRFLMYLIASPVGRQLVMGHVKGVAQSGINLGDLRKLPTPVPPVAEQDAVVGLLDSHLARIDELGRAMSAGQARVDLLDQAILAKAFRGELVPQDPEDEPAAVLLERIRAEREGRR